MARRPAQETDATQSSARRPSPGAAIRHRLPGGLTFSRLTLTIVIANLIGLVILMLGSLGMTQYRDGLVAAKLEGVRAQAQVIADIMAQVAADDTACDESEVAQTNLTPGCAVTLREDAVNLVFSRVWDSFEGRVRVFNAPRDFDALMGGDPRELLLEDVVLRKDEFEISTLPDIEEAEGVGLLSAWTGFRDWLVEVWPASRFEKDAAKRSLQQELNEAFLSAPSGERGVTSVRYNEEGELVASVSVPIRKVQAVYGVVTAEIGGIQDLVDDARGAILPFFIYALVAAFLSSLLLTAAIAQPIRQLAIAADRVREGIAVAGRVRVPDFSSRHDEIGELSSSLRAMTNAIYARIEAIESFAADVSHELKNPLTSIRSAVETLRIAKTPESQEKLMKVITQDVQRMDRLITDISNASRLDAELARETREVVDLGALLKDIVDMYAATRKEGRAPVSLAGPEVDAQGILLGSPSALGQVFRNLIDNAISFSPADGVVRVRWWLDGEARDNRVIITVSDDGPGIPEESLENIFKRFYTKRPEGTAFGNNSGLGLAISRQIVESHGGHIAATNRTDGASGAIFTVTLPVRSQ
ncbi:sensor histidine kinase [Aquisalinus flavus]|uniref:histidine kinase n=1 Tax=Aquisalinus flavus TaxID=1526572 RepID=A0A8J2V2C5_9PROT|nr:sensor histidine kinase [Aquisalinus flavus]MBD0425193.1 sensor histidine kinase [Aquisalinus flavus]UNE49144.1 HAMP domain-containing protein [Aquisalinus flavus]GGD18022.1 histidine kinase [Aquisalinus flavus]